MVDPEQARAAAAAAAQQMQPPASAAMAQPGNESVATGGMPPGLEPPPMPVDVGGAGNTLPNELRGLME